MKEEISEKHPFLTLFYDGACPLCKREVSWISKRTSSVVYVDIAASDFAVEDYVSDLKHSDLMREIRGLDVNGELVTGMDVFRLLYNDAGLGFLAWVTSLPLLSPSFDAAYRVFARVRLWHRKRDSSCERCIGGE